MSEFKPGIRGMEIITRGKDNTFVMNCVLQCLTKTSFLKDFFLEDHYQKEINLRNPLGHGGKVANAFADLMKEMWSESDNNQTLIKTTDLRKVVEDASGRGVGEMDGMEFVNFILDALHEDMNRILNKPMTQPVKGVGENVDKVEISKKSFLSYRMRNDSKIVETFYGQLCSEIFCKGCQTRNINFDPQYGLSLPIPKNVLEEELTLEKCYAEFCKTDELSGQNKWYCRGKCKGFVDAENSVSCFMTPKVLTIHLKRVTFGRQGREKDERLVHFPLEIDTKSMKIADGNSENQNEKYRLFGVVNHFYRRFDSIYNAFVRIGEVWYVFDVENPEKVEVMDESKVCTKGAYVLFYEAI